VHTYDAEDGDGEGSLVGVLVGLEEDLEGDLEGVLVRMVGVLEIGLEGDMELGLLLGDLEIVALWEGETLRGAVEYGIELEGLLDGVWVGMVGLELTRLREGVAVGLDGLVEAGLLEGVMEGVDGLLVDGRLDGPLEASVSLSMVLPYEYGGIIECQHIDKYSTC
jgi:hypothetical protein